MTDHTFTLTAHAKARGWDAAFGPGVLRLAEDGQGGRGRTPGPGTVPGTGGCPGGAEPWAVECQAPLAGCASMVDFSLPRLASYCRRTIRASSGSKNLKMPRSSISSVRVTRVPPGSAAKV